MMALDFMAGQETARVNKEHKRAGQRARGATSPQGTGSVSQLRTEAAECLGQEEEEDCSICQVGRGMDNFVAEGIDHMECDTAREGSPKHCQRNHLIADQVIGGWCWQVQDV